MTTGEIKNLLQSERYDFLRQNPHLKNKIILLGLGGSHAYGTNTEKSDIDVRGAAISDKREILLGKDFEQVTEDKTDTIIYSLSKFVSLLTACNPNVIEMLGLRREDYFIITYSGQILLDNKKLFLSQKAVNSFGGYANQQLRRLENKSSRLADIESQTKNMWKITQNILTQYPDTNLKTYIEKDGETPNIYVDINVSRYPLHELNTLLECLKLAEQTNTKLGKRNANAITHDKLAKHAMHLIRLYYMAIDILEREEIITYRANEHDLLMDIRNGKYMIDETTPSPEFFELVNDLEKRFQYAIKNTSLPRRPDQAAIDELLYSIVSEITAKQD